MKEIHCTEVYDVPVQYVREVLTPKLIVEHIGTYEIYDVSENDETVIEVGTGELEATLAFTELENGYEYHQVGDAGPYEEMVTTVTFEQTENSNVAVSFVSHVSFDLPLSTITDRIGAWNRKKELERALLSIASDLDDQTTEANEEQENK